MAKFKQLNFHIDRSSYSLGSVCSIHYEYFLSFDPIDLDEERHYLVFCELWGVTTVREKRLLDEKLDRHEFTAKHSMDLSRAFVVPCEVLNEKVGEDKIFIKLKLVEQGRIIDVIESDEISDSF